MNDPLTALQERLDRVEATNEALNSAMRAQTEINASLHRRIRSLESDACTMHREDE